MIAVDNLLEEDQFVELRKVPVWNPDGPLPEWLDGTDLPDEPPVTSIPAEAFAAHEAGEEPLVSINELASCWK